MKLYRTLVCFILSLWFWAPAKAQKSYALDSPNSRLSVVISVDDSVRFSLYKDGAEIVSPSKIGLTLQEGEQLFVGTKVAKTIRTSVNTSIPTLCYRKDTVTDRYNELILKFRGNYSVIFRMYDDGMAYRFGLDREGETIIEQETAAYRFPKDYKTYTAYVNNADKKLENQFYASFENTYTTKTLTELDPNRLKMLPLLIDLEKNGKLCITESDLEDYPGMMLNNDPDRPVLEAIHARYPSRCEVDTKKRLYIYVREREEYIARTSALRLFPWRAFIVVDRDEELADNDMVYRLASPCRIEDPSWIKPGKVAWDWWSNWNLYGVDFRAGVNNDTYKYFIDFAAKYGLEYIILDAGWSVYGAGDLMQVVPEIDLEELVAYGNSKNVGLILWAGCNAFEKDMEKAVRHFAEMGIKGFKIDYMNRDDQWMVDFLYRAAKTCADHHMVVDFHGVYKPTGLNRTYPNVLNFEGVWGMEQMKWSSPSSDMVTYDVTIPFIRMLAGPMDYTPGAMRNAGKSNYRPVNSEPMSQGTRCRQLAMYVVFDAPLNMLSDSPSNYLQEKECTEFIADVPTVWDETKILQGKVAEYIVTARKKDSEWYLGAMTDWDARELEVDLSFVGKGDFEIEYFTDGINADRAARDYKKVIAPLPSDREITLKMAPGGGFAARIYPIK
ncbi:MAG TPA: glycoside hydrolase family 97 protein [Candidatus Alistipes merdigallinarum]|nr:glycoside hydrolase family 97 protein [Candidatus Alistipes merdigallinarum]